MRHKKFKQDDVEKAKNKINALLKTNAKIESLTDDELYILTLIIQKEFEKRGSDFARIGFNPNKDLI